MTANTAEDKPLVVAGRELKSRLIIGTGKYESYEQNARALEASGAEMITVALRRVNLRRIAAVPLRCLPCPRRVAVVSLRGLPPRVGYSGR